MTPSNDQETSATAHKPKGGPSQKRTARNDMDRLAAEEAAARFEQAVQQGLEGVDDWWKSVEAQPPDAVASAMASRWASLEPDFKQEVISFRHMRSLPLDIAIPLQLSLSLALNAMDADKARNMLVVACNGMVGNGSRPPGGKHLKAFQHYMLRGSVPALTLFDFAGRPSLETKNLLACIAAGAFPRGDRLDAKQPHNYKSTDKRPSHEHEPPLMQWLLNNSLFGQMTADHQKRVASRAAAWPDDTKKNFTSHSETENTSQKLPQEIAQALRVETVPAVKGVEPAPPSPVFDTPVTTIESIGTKPPSQSPSEPPATPPHDVPSASLVGLQAIGEASAAELLRHADDLRRLLKNFTEAREKDSREAADRINAAQQEVQIFRKERDDEKLKRTSIEEENGDLRKKMGDAETALQAADAQAADLRQQVTRLTEELTASMQQAQQANERQIAEESRHRQDLQDMRERFARDKRDEVQVFINGLSDKLRLEWREFHAGEDRQMDAESGASLRKFVQRMFGMLEREGLKFRR